MQTHLQVLLDLVDKVELSPFRELFLLKALSGISLRQVHEGELLIESTVGESRSFGREAW